MAHAKALDRITVHGTTDEVTTCEHCGRVNLKATVALSVDDGPIVHFGSDCAATALKVSKASITKAVKAFEKTERDTAAAAREKAEAERTAPWFAFLAKHGEDNAIAIANLGGYVAAKEAFANA